MTSFDPVSAMERRTELRQFWVREQMRATRSEDEQRCLGALPESVRAEAAPILAAGGDDPWSVLSDARDITGGSSILAMRAVGETDDPILVWFIFRDPYPERISPVFMETAIYDPATGAFEIATLADAFTRRGRDCRPALPDFLDFGG